MFTTLNGTVFICEFTFYLLFCMVRVFGVCVYYVYLYTGQVPELKLMMMMMISIRYNNSFFLPSKLVLGDRHSNTFAVAFVLPSLGGAVVERRTRDRMVAGSTPGWGAIKSTRSTQPSIPPG